VLWASFAGAEGRRQGHGEAAAQGAVNPPNAAQRRPGLGHP